MLVQLAEALLSLLASKLYVLAEGPGSENFLSVRRATYLGFEYVEELVAQVLLVEELDDETGDVDLDGPLRVSHKSDKEAGDHLQKANFVAPLNLVDQEVVEVEFQDPVYLSEEEVPLSEHDLRLGRVLRLEDLDQSQ